MKRGMSKVIAGILALMLALALIVVSAPVFAGDSATDSISDTASHACTNILVGNDASVDDSTISTYCCDGARYAKVKVILGETYRPGTMIPVYYRPPVYNYETYLAYLEYLENPTLIGEIPQVEETYSYVNLQVWYYEDQVGGINEYGLTIGETTIGGRKELRNENGLLYIYTGLQQNSLMSLALERAKTAREAIEIMGSLAEEYGYLQSGEHVTISDGDEIWAFEIFGPGEDWEPGCGKPGAVWCAQRIPDAHVGVSANRSRIGLIDDNNPDYEFMHSPNVYSLALEKGWWDGVELFVWYEAYAPSTRVNLREWEVLNLVAPSLNLDPDEVRHPFSVEPDELVSVQDIMAIHRDYYKGTPFDITEDPAFYVDGEKSPMACPFGPRDLHNLLGLRAKRSVATASSVFSYVSQVRADLPDPIKGCMWLGFGPAVATCYVPVYSGVTELPESWSETELTRVNRENSWWAFNLADQLPLIKWQDAIEDVKGVRDPAEACFFAQQPDLESTIIDLYSGRAEAAAEQLATKLVTNYTCSCMNAVSEGYWELVDYLLFTYYFRGSGGAPQELPSIECPPVPTNPGRRGK